MLVFAAVIRIILTKDEFRSKKFIILWLSIAVVVFGMLFGRYGALWGLPWWVYYTIPMLVTVFLPPKVLQLNRKRTLTYLLLSFLSAPFIHAVFSFFLGWNEYMPFWKIPSIHSL